MKIMEDMVRCLFRRRYRFPMVCKEWVDDAVILQLYALGLRDLIAFVPACFFWVVWWGGCNCAYSVEGVNYDLSR